MTIKANPPHTPFTKSELEDDERRREINAILKNREWEMTVRTINFWEDRGFCFLGSPYFKDLVFLHKKQVPQGISIDRGDIVSAIVSLGKDNARNLWGFRAKITKKISDHSKIKKTSSDSTTKNSLSGAGETKKTGKPRVRRKSKKYNKEKIKITVNAPKKVNRVILEQLEGERLAVTAASNFAIDDEFLSIYIDEAWPSMVNPEIPNQGVIGGIVWRGFQPDYSKLPHIETHLRSSDDGIKSLSNLLKCEYALPFVMPIEANFQINQTCYFDLIVCALKVLLGWLLPQKRRKCKVRILLEWIDKMGTATDQKDYFKGVLEEARLANPHRFSRWDLEAVKWSMDKSEEYIPYADLVAYLSHEYGAANIEMGKKVDYRRWPGYVPLSIELVPNTDTARPG